MFVGYETDQKRKYHLYFVRAFKRTKQEKKRKTPIYIVRKDSSSSYAEMLGLIKWHGAFRQFCFYPDTKTIWSKGCLELINNFLDKVNKRYRNKLRKKSRR